MYINIYNLQMPSFSLVSQHLSLTLLPFNSISIQPRHSYTVKKHTPFTLSSKSNTTDTSNFPRVSTSTTTGAFSSKPTSQSRSRASCIEDLRSLTRRNLFQEAIFTYIEMVCFGIAPDNFAFPAVLKATAGVQDLDLGKQIHAHVVKSGYASSSVTVANTLVHMYGKCDRIEDACQVFERIPEKDQVSWNTMIATLCRFEEWQLAMEVFRLMLEERVEPSSFTLVGVAHACSNLGKLDGLPLGKQVHAWSLRKGDWKTFTVNALMAMYAKLGRVNDAKALFFLFSEDGDMVSWNTIISSLSQNDQFMEAFSFLQLMVIKGFKPDRVTIASVLPACSHLKMLNYGKEIHSYALKNTDIIENPFVDSALVDMYCNCQQVVRGRLIFEGVQEKTIAVWNAMITGYAQNEFDEEALRLFIEMEGVAGVSPNASTMSSIIPACVRHEAFLDREGIHGYIVKKGLDNDRFVQNALMDMYSRMGKIEISKSIFESMKIRDIVSWNTMITGYIVCGCYIDALNLLHMIQREEEARKKINGDYDDERGVYNLRPNSVTLLTVLPGCAALSALAKGKEIHAFAVRQLLASDVAVGSALVDMYAKCGCLDLSRRLFDQMPIRNIITWNVLIMAYGMHGKGEEASKLFERMVTEQALGGEVKPNEVTFIAVFAACSHSGMVDEGLELFYKMNDHGVEPTADHYACVVDLLGRSGRVKEAYELINSMPLIFNKAGAWSSLLGSCRIHHNVEIGEIAAENLFILQPTVASHYVLLSNIYSSAGLWNKAMDVRKKMKVMGVRKEPGCSWIEFGDEVHKFLVGDASHPQSKEVREFIERLSERMRKEGYVPDTSCVLHNVDDDEKETLLCGHSEKLAVALGILNTPPRTTIRVAKNLRVCNDCHVACKFISKMEDREIILRDVRRFHHFKKGICSCGDYW